MPDKVKTMYCGVCKDQRRFVAERPSGCLHTFLTFITFGLWLFVWPFFYARSGTSFRCSVCGSSIGQARKAS